MDTPETQRPPRGFYKTTLLIGLGFFTMGLMDPLYDAYIPLFLGDYLSSRFLIGLVMTLDNILALLLIPMVAAFSDTLSTPLGRRMPIIIITLPLSALFFAALPWGALPLGSLSFLVVAIFLLNLSKQAARGPVVALMPDLTPESYRSQANGVINFMGGIAAIVGTIVLAPMMDINIDLPLIGSSLRKIPFLIAGGLVLLATILLFVLVREPQTKPVDKTPRVDKQEKTPGFFDKLGTLLAPQGDQDSSGKFILLALFFWFLGYQGMIPFVTTYSRDVLGTSEGLAGLSPGAVAIAYAIFAIPSGILAQKIGRRLVLKIGLGVIITVLVLVFLHGPLSSLLRLDTMARWISFLVLLFVFGAAWGSVVTNSFPMLWNLADEKTMGFYTGMYYVFSQGAAILAPLVSGALIDGSTAILGEQGGLSSIYLMAAVCMVVAYFFISKVKRIH